MPTNKTILYGVLILNAIIVIVNVTAWQHIWGPTKKMSMVALTVLNTTTNSANLRGSSNNAFITKNSSDGNAEGDSISLPPLPHTTANSPNLRGSNKREFIDGDSPDRNATGEPASLPPFVHPFDRLSKRLEHFDWDPVRIDEFLRKYWDTERSFIRYRVDRQKKNNTILSTSCLHTAAWIVVGLLELQTRPNIYRGLYKIPKDKDLVVYDNTGDSPSIFGAPVIQSLQSFIDSRPLNDSILLQVDMYQLPSSHIYTDHHFAIHIYNGSISLYQGWQDDFNLIEWMTKPSMYNFRYPMPLETFFTHFEKFINYTEEENEVKERLEAIWAIFGNTDQIKPHRKGIDDSTVLSLRNPWVVSLITHWPSPPAMVLGLQSDELPQV